MKIVIWTGGALETWGPHSIIEGGIGGSETAAIRMADELSMRGHHVEIWGRVVPATIMPPGGGRVLYVPFDGSQADSREEPPSSARRESSREGLGRATGPTLSGFPSQIECDIFISSRELSALTDLGPRCRLSVLWMHDAHAGEDWQNQMIGYDVVFCLSRWARGFLMGYYDRVPENKFVVTRNGIEPSLFLREDETLESHGLESHGLESHGLESHGLEPNLDRVYPVMKEGHKFIYSSSPDRGLGRLLGMWPAIKDKIPDAELHVYYGFDNLRAWHALHPSLGGAEKLLQVDYLEHRLDDLRASGVYHHGRVGQKELAQAFMDSLVWLYPTSFCETFCITALEAQAAGCWPVTSRVGALPETLFGGILVDDPQEPAYDRIFVRKVVDYVNDVDGCRTASSAARWANRRRVLGECSWRSVAVEWERLFGERLGEP